MTYFTLLLVIKILVTFVFVVAPFLVLPRSRLESLMKVTTERAVLFRLLGVAYLALLVAYGFGIPAAEAGVFPWSVAATGVVSNAGAAFILFAMAPDRRDKISALFLAGITAGIVASMFAPEFALSTVGG